MSNITSSNMKREIYEQYPSVSFFLHKYHVLICKTRKDTHTETNPYPKNRSVAMKIPYLPDWHIKANEGAIVPKSVFIRPNRFLEQDFVYRRYIVLEKFITPTHPVSMVSEGKLFVCRRKLLVTSTICCCWLGSLIQWLNSWCNG